MEKMYVISSCSFGTAANPTSNTRIDLTPLDLQLIPYSPVQRGLLFHNPEQLHEFKTIIHHLKTSLSRTLDFFPPLAGRLGTLKNNDTNTISLFIDCNNAGVKFTHAIANNVSVSDILDPIYVPEIVSSFFPQNGFTNYEGISNPLLAVQITELVDGYFIGCTANHAVVDGISFWHFVNSWSEISRGCDSISKSPVFENNWFPSKSSPNSIPVPSNEKRPDFSPPPLLERVFLFSTENIAKLKDKANLEAGTDKISSLQAISAHVWRSVTRVRKLCRGTDEDQDQICCCVLSVSMRERFNFPDGFFGNCVSPAKFATTEAEILLKGFGWAAMKLSEAVAQKSSEEEVQLEWVKKSNVVNKVIKIISVSVTPSFDVYGNDFGWGKPVATRSCTMQKFDGLMTVSPAPESDGGGLHMQVCLDPQVLRAMGEDEEFMEVVTV